MGNFSPRLSLQISSMKTAKKDQNKSEGDTSLNEIANVGVI